jgi:alpha-galactosidase
LLPSWNYFGCNINEDTILTAANALVSTGLRDLGYECTRRTCLGRHHLTSRPSDVIVDDCKLDRNEQNIVYKPTLLGWHAPKRDPNTGAPMADPTRFSNGIKHLAGAVHALGLKFGIYSSAGTMTCGRQFGSLGHEEIDAQTYAEWGIDYLSASSYANFTNRL